MTSFLKIFPRSKPNGKELKGPFVPLDTVNLEYSISAVSANLSLYCKSCKALQQQSPRDDSKVDGHAFSGLLGIISKGIFMIYQVDLNSSDQFSSNILQTVQIPHVNSPLVKPTITLVRRT